MIIWYVCGTHLLMANNATTMKMTIAIIIKRSSAGIPTAIPIVPIPVALLWFDVRLHTVN